MNELLTIINLSQALSKSFNADILRLDIHYNNEKDITEAYLYLDGAVDIAKITGYGEVTIFHDKELRGKEEPSFIKELESEPGTAAEAMEEMKAAVDSLEISKKPKKRSNDMREKILNRYNQGYTKVKMAEELGIGISTVNYHLQKLQVEGRI